MKRLDVHFLDPAGGSPGNVPAINAAGTAVEWAASSGGGATSLDGLSDVDTTTLAPTDGDTLTYDGASGLWAPAAPATGGGGGASSLLARPQGTLQRSYGFDSTTEGWTASAGTLAVDANGRLKHTVAMDGSTHVLLEPSSAPSVADGEFVMDVSEVANNGTNALEIGLFFRATDVNNTYMLSVRTGAVSSTPFVELYKRVSGTFTSLGASQGFATNDPVRRATVGVVLSRLMVRFVGQHIRAYLDETFIGAWNDATFTTGRCGLRHFARTGAPSQVCYWDNAQVYSLASTWKPPAY